MVNAITKSQKSDDKTNSIISDKNTVNQSRTNMFMREQKLYHTGQKKNKKNTLVTEQTQKPALVQNILQKGKAIVQKIVAAVKNTFSPPKKKIVRNNKLPIHHSLIARKKLRVQRRSLVRSKSSSKKKTHTIVLIKERQAALRGIFGY